MDEGQSNSAMLELSGFSRPKACLPFRLKEQLLSGAGGRVLRGAQARWPELALSHQGQTADACEGPGLTPDASGLHSGETPPSCSIFVNTSLI